MSEHSWNPFSDFPPIHPNDLTVSEVAIIKFRTLEMLKIDNEVVIEQRIVKPPSISNSPPLLEILARSIYPVYGTTDHFVWRYRAYYLQNPLIDHWMEQVKLIPEHPISPCCCSNN